jgi:hypothetical protein
MTILVALAVLSLFTPFRVSVPLVHLRPFDALAFGTLAYALSTGRVFPRGGLPLGFVALLPYLAWHVISALGVSVDNGAREGLQILTVLAFAWATVVELETMEFRRLGLWLLVGMVLITVYSIGWHVANGYWTGWKRLVDPKATFTFLPLLVATLLVANAFSRRALVWLGWAVLGAAILMSGERKALIVFAVLSAGLLARGRVLPFVLVTGAALAVLAALSTVIDDPYLSRQVASVVNPLDAGDYSTAVSTGEAAQGDSRSNAQRGFAAALARTLITNNLIVGIGTNQYERIIEQQFAYLPEFLRNGIHGEFLRVLTENGLVGLLAYLSIWFLAAVRTRGVLANAVRLRQLSPAQGALLPLITFVPCLIYVAFEASGTHSLIVLAFASLYPDLVRTWLAPVPEVSRLPMRPRPEPGPARRRGAFAVTLPRESTL